MAFGCAEAERVSGVEAQDDLLVFVIAAERTAHPHRAGS
jgi:hypothetical protein